MLFFLLQEIKGNRTPWNLHFLFSNAMYLEFVASIKLFLWKLWEELAFCILILGVALGRARFL